MSSIIRRLSRARHLDTQFETRRDIDVSRQFDTDAELRTDPDADTFAGGAR